jgi:hypothetical protein
VGRTPEATERDDEQRTLAMRGMLPAEGAECESSGPPRGEQFSRRFRPLTALVPPARCRLRAPQSLHLVFWVSKEDWEDREESEDFR